MVKELRMKTGTGIMDCKRALQETNGDFDQAVELLRQKGMSEIRKRSSKAASEGQIAAYIHGDGKIGVLVEVNCETDFVARTEGFRTFVREIAMQVAAANPLYIKREDIAEEVIERERSIFRTQSLEQGKPEKVVDRIVEGKLKKFFQEVCLMEQVYIRDDKKTIQDLLNELIATLGENIYIRRLCRYQLGEDLSE
ncbi:MAG: translation elongation factor Ts [Deltaproteobacteria bacterium]|nr:translation elongation factor Ts [Deltaproteobacteria bacterium]